MYAYSVTYSKPEKKRI
uniref:Uncharacterized protein n=1 Tax=Anguilla anguilla TaxID=7936 RepID=A0A0E9S7E6_ANGAN